jgi:hypothetical protein
MFDVLISEGKLRPQRRPVGVETELFGGPAHQRRFQVNHHHPVGPLSSQLPR